MKTEFFILYLEQGAVILNIVCQEAHEGGMGYRILTSLWIFTFFKVLSLLV